MSSHLGGDRDPMVVAWPAKIKADGTVRAQFTHCIDIAPTVLEVIGLPEPKVVDGIAQEPMDGTSFGYTFAGAQAAERHTVQYFEMISSRATVTLWANGKLAGEGKMGHTVPIVFTSYAGMDIGRDNGLVVDLDYEDKAPYAFTGTVKKVVFDLKPRGPRGREGTARARADAGDRPGSRRVKIGDTADERHGG